MKMVLLAVLLALSVATAHAQTTFGFDFTWDDPVAREDGTPFDPATELEFYVLSCVSVKQEAEVTVPRDVTADGTYRWTDAVNYGGLYDCKMAVTDTDGNTSDWSNVVQVQRTARPSPPVLRGGK